MPLTTSRRSVWGARACVLLLCTLSAVATRPLPVSAAPPAPGSPSAQPSGGSAPALSWLAAPGAARYEVQVDDDPGFGSPYGGTVTTVNTTYVPTATLSAEANHWRVRSLDAKSQRSDWVTGTFDVPRVGTPSTTAPSDNAVLAQPGNPPLLTWTASAGADAYLVEVDADSDFVGAKTYSTKTTSLVVPDPLSVGDWFWRVTATKGKDHVSRPSAVARFVIDSIAPPVGVGPLNNQAVRDIVLDWDPMPGARTYDVQVATDEAFTDGDSMIAEVRGVKGTRYSPPTTFANTTYFWRVRAVDPDGQPTQWRHDRFTFTRDYPFTPRLVHPAAAGNEVVSGPLWLQWTPVRHASEYELWLGSDPNFSPNTFDVCRTAATTYTPGAVAVNLGSGLVQNRRSHELCRPQAGSTTYWKVRALDGPYSKGSSPYGVQSNFSEVQGFDYRPQVLTDLAPVGGASVDVPTLTWRSTTGAESYKLEIYDAAGSRMEHAETAATSYTPTTPLPPSGNPYEWRIRAYGVEGSSSLLYEKMHFQVSGTPPSGGGAALPPLTPTPGTPGLQEAPSLTWVPMPGAAYYTVDVGPASDPPHEQVWFGGERDNLFHSALLAFPGMTDTSQRLSQPGAYDWRVIAYGPDHKVLGTGPEARFTIEPLRGVTGHAVAVDGDHLTGAGTPCTVTSGACVVPSTPTLSWARDPHASYYLVYVSRDRSFTNLLEPETSMSATTNTMYTPTLANRAHTYDDRLAGEAYYWHVRPCRSSGICGPSPLSTPDSAQHSFRKESPRPGGLASSDPAGSEITFTWNDYLDDNLATVWPQTGERSNQAAKQYRIQVDEDPSFGLPLVDSRVVDQPTYTAPDLLYPEGTYYWRVQAIDSDDNGLLWSHVSSFTKRSPAVAALSPAGERAAADALTFRWTAQEFASGYDLEVYRANDGTHSAANRVVSKTGVKTTAYAHTVPLPPSSEPYLWRVRRVDAHGNKGPWSADVSFRVVSAVPAITAPADGGSQPATAPVVTWSAVPGAASYAASIRPVTGTGTTESATTGALGYAARTRFSTGSYLATITAKDLGGSDMGASTVAFSVDAGITALGPAQIHAPGGTGVGQTLTATDPVWNQPDVTNAYQWLRDGTAISGATGTTYTLTLKDLDKGVSLRVTGSRPNFDDGVSVSNVIGGSAGGALQATAVPLISGTATAGSTLKVSTGTWSQETPTLGYQWLRSGAPIPGATGATYRLTTQDAGQPVSATVLASKIGFTDGAVSAAAVMVAKLASTTTLALSSERVTTSKKPKKPKKSKKPARVSIGITVAVPGTPGPVGQVKVFDGAKALTTLTLVSTRNGRTTWTLPKLKKGKHKIKAVYLGTPSVAGSASKITKLYVVR